MRQIRQHRAKVAGLDASMADESTLLEQRYIVDVYLKFPPNHVNKLNADLLVQLTQRWSDEEFIAAFNRGKT